MTIELTQNEAELLIAILTFAEGNALALQNPAMSVAIADLRHWRSRLMEVYLRSRIEQETR
jgi:hypothetical protein